MKDFMLLKVGDYFFIKNHKQKNRSLVLIHGEEKANLHKF